MLKNDSFELNNWTNNEEDSLSSNSSNCLQSKNEICNDKDGENNVSEVNLSENEKEKLKEDNERLKTDVEVLSKKLHDAVSRIGNLEKALAKKDSIAELKNNIENISLLQKPTSIEIINSKTTKALKPNNTTTKELNITLDSDKNTEKITSPLMYSTTTTTTTTTTTSSIQAGKVFSTSKNTIIENDSTNENKDRNINKDIVTTIKDLENTIDILNKRLLDEVERRSELECSHSALVQETEDLTVKLFEEAQTMVATEKRQLFEKNKQVNQLKTIIEDKDSIIQALLEENRTLKQYAQQKIQITENQTRMRSRSMSFSTGSSTASENQTRLNRNRSISISSGAMSTTPATATDDNKENIKDAANYSKLKVRNNKITSDLNKTLPLSINTNLEVISEIDKSKENEVKILLATSPFSPSNGIFNISSEIDNDQKVYQTYAFQTIHKQMRFDSKNIYYNEILNFIKYNHYELIENSKFSKRCIVEEVEPCLDFQPVNPNMFNISTKYNHYNKVRKLIKACKDSSIIIQNIYEYPEQTTNDEQNVQKTSIPKSTNVTCSLCLRDNLSLPLLRCYMDDDDRETKSTTNNVDIYVCPYCKERLLSVSEFYGCLKYIKNLKWDNNAKSNPQEMCHRIYGDLLRIRERIYWAKIGLISQDSGLNIGGILND